MGIDGLSMTNLGMERNRTSSQMASEAEATARQCLENQIPDVDGVGKKEKAGRKDSEAAFNGFVPFIPDNKKKKEQENAESQIDIKEGEEQPQDDEDDIEEFDENNEEDYDEENGEHEECSNYHFKYTSDDMIEIYDSKTNRIIKKIPAQQAANVSLNVRKMPGIFINRKV